MQRDTDARVRRLMSGKAPKAAPREIIPEGSFDANDIDTIPEAVKITVACWLLKHLVEHAQDPGTFRHLVYKRLGLGLPAYTPMLNAGGMTVATFFDLIGKREPHGDSVRLPVEPTERIVQAIRLNTPAGKPPLAVSEALAIYAAILIASGRDCPPPPQAG